MKYELTFVCEKDGHVVEQGYDVSFSYDPSQYGNGTYMYCENHNPEYTDYSFDIRYDQEYSEDEQKQFILNWALNTWNGEKGSYRITQISIKEMDECSR